MESFIGLDVEQTTSKISLHLDVYVRETLNIYKVHHGHPGTQMLRPKSTPMQPGNVLTSSEDIPEEPNKKRQAFYRSMVARLQFAATWVRFDISYTVGIMDYLEKHIDIRKHFAHEAVQVGHLRLHRVSTSYQLANVFTKGL